MGVQAEWAKWKISKLRLNKTQHLLKIVIHEEFLNNNKMKYLAKLLYFLWNLFLFDYFYKIEKKYCHM